MQETEKDYQNLKKRFVELANKSYSTNQYMFTPFLNMAELDLFYQTVSAFSHVPYTAFGGSLFCERKMIRFGSKELFSYEEPFPIVCIEVAPLLEKFSDTFSHRDFLGACMNLGIERNLLGDIVVKEKHGYIFCQEKIAPFLIENLTKIKHTNVNCVVCENEIAVLAPNFEKKTLVLASERIDGIVAKTYKLSRSESLTLFQSKKIFINDKMCENNSATLKPLDIVSVRGFGKFRYDGMMHETKKGKCSVDVSLYV